MSQLRTSNLSVDPPTPPPTGTRIIYTKAAGLFCMDEFGVVSGPFTGGGGPPSGAAGGSLSGTYPNPGIAAGAVGTNELGGSAVTTPKIAAQAVGTAAMADNSITNAKIQTDAVQTAQIANNSVTNPKIANNAVSAAKIGNPLGIDKFIYADTGSTWAFGYPPRVHFGTDPAGPYVARISVLGDLGTSVDPLNPRILNHAAADAALGYVARFLSHDVKASEDLVLLADTPPTFIRGREDIVAPATITLPDSRKYPPGAEITFYLDSAASANITIPVNGTIPPFTSITAPLGTGAQTITPGTGRKFTAYYNLTGNRGWLLSATIPS